MRRADEQLLARAIAEAAKPVHKPALHDLVERGGLASLVLIGEASHGTHEFYRLRAELTKHLITEKGFTAVAVEADWPDAYRVNRYVRGLGHDRDAESALGDFERFPTWMWRNTDVRDFVAWLRAHNEGLHGEQVGFYGLDLYSLHGSMQAVLAYLEHEDPEAAARARYRYACFGHFHEDPEGYGYAASLSTSQSCEDQAVAQLLELERRRSGEQQELGLAPDDELFAAAQNARVVRNAERYYRTMFHGNIASWNRRDEHMAETLEALLAHQRRSNDDARIVVWAHNSHVGDARATELGERGETNLGREVRLRHDDAVLIGFTTYEGTVTAASSWGSHPERKRVRPGILGSYEALFHATGLHHFVLDLRGLYEAAGALREARLERAIGVIYRPESERLSHYFEARLPEQFDAIIHHDLTRAVTPLQPGALWHSGEPPETYPTGL